MNGEIRNTKKLTQQSRVKLYLPTRLPWLTIKWSFLSYANNSNNLKAFVGQAFTRKQVLPLISIIHKTYSVNVHKEFVWIGIKRKLRTCQQLQFPPSAKRSGGEDLVTLLSKWHIFILFILKGLVKYICYTLSAHPLWTWNIKSIILFNITACAVCNRNNMHPWLTTYSRTAQLFLVLCRRMRDWSTRFVRGTFEGNL